MTKPLQGWTDILDYKKCSRETLLKMAYEEGYPLSKEGGRWVLDLDLEKEWRRERIKQGKNLPSQN